MYLLNFNQLHLSGMGEGIDGLTNGRRNGKTKGATLLISINLLVITC